MADATVTGRRQNNVSGNRREVFATSIVMNTGDTWDTKLKQVDVICLTPTSNIAVWGFTVSGGVITLVGGASPSTFRGKVEGY